MLSWIRHLKTLFVIHWIELCVIVWDVLMLQDENHFSVHSQSARSSRLINHSGNYWRSEYENMDWCFPWSSSVMGCRHCTKNWRALLTVSRTTKKFCVVRHPPCHGKQIWWYRRWRRSRSMYFFCGECTLSTAMEMLFMVPKISTTTATISIALNLMQIELAILARNWLATPTYWIPCLCKPVTLCHHSLFFCTSGRTPAPAATYVQS